MHGLKALLTADIPAKGKPFPKINGPKPHERVCIVGAGPSGIHMAISLKDINTSLCLNNQGMLEERLLIHNLTGSIAHKEQYFSQ